MAAVSGGTAFISNRSGSDKLKTRQADFDDAIFMAVCDEYNVSYEVKTYETAEGILSKLTHLHWILNKIVNR